MLLLMLAVGLMAGCGANESNEGNGSNEATVIEPPAGIESASGSEENEAAFPAVLVDGSGEEITIEEEPQTIVSLLSSNTEIAFALGLGDKIIGVSNFCNYPAAAQEKEKLGGQAMNVERIIELQPDMALVSQYHFKTHADVLNTFRQAGIDVVVAGEAKSFEDAYETMRMFGKATGTLDKAEAIIADMQERLAEVKSKAEAVETPKRVWIEVSPAPDIFTTGKETFMHEMIEAINAANVAGDQTGWVKMTEEEIVSLMPDVIITTYGYYVENPSEGVYAREGWAEVPAVANQQVYDVDSDTVTRPGPRLIDGVEELARFVYPDIFIP
ncbi:putative ABC transporter substrate-binding lipoprotein YvrC [Xylanibacillus composti]|uniref:Putative ABC transporter substrate-binding lipoprotein YvrC n=1 Tax=Xylanibacillus composti TaxID=1572762 RepID=A0A8J4M149_9BACL|nr:putative ABC transporter substrate-binding lipoprotein YvrC [Xylanibacillus composti]